MTIAEGEGLIERGEKEQVSESMIDAALMARIPGGAEVWHWLPQKDAWTPHQTALDVMRCALEAALKDAPLAAAEAKGLREGITRAIATAEWLRDNAATAMAHQTAIDLVAELLLLVPESARSALAAHTGGK